MPIMKLQFDGIGAWLGSALILGGMCMQTPAQETNPPQLPRPEVDEIGRTVTAFMAKHQIPGLSIAIVADGELVWSNGYGMADVENSVPAKATTAYRSASIGKTMTATAAMQLAERGKLDLNAGIRDYCPAFPPKQWKITSLNLLTHTSGIRHYGGPRDQEEQNSSVHYPSVVEALTPFKDDPLLFEPGTKYLYSTYGFDVLGCVIQGAAKVPFLTYMSTHVWGPSGMKATRDDDPSAIISNRAAKYTLAGGELRNAPMIDMSNRLPAGGYITTAVDLAKFAQAVLGDRLLKPETFQRMIVPTKLPSGESVEYGLGWGMELEAWHGDSYVFHGGSSPGESGFLVLMPRHRFAVAFLTNLDGVPDRGLLAEDVTRIVLGFGPRKE
jgi:serine beta-lactamase-like protein LACTB, mitochondrial